MIYNITPVAAPRMTQADRWKKRPPVLRYFAFRDEVKLAKVKLSDEGNHIIFTLPMPDSWSAKKKKQMLDKPHQQRPDADNLLKAICDAVYEEDCMIWDIRVTKVWGATGKIEVRHV